MFYSLYALFSLIDTLQRSLMGDRWMTASLSAE